MPLLSSPSPSVVGHGCGYCTLRRSRSWRSHCRRRASARPGHRCPRTRSRGPSARRSRRSGLASERVVVSVRASVVHVRVDVEVFRVVGHLLIVVRAVDVVLGHRVDVLPPFGPCAVRSPFKSVLLALALEVSELAAVVAPRLLLQVLHALPGIRLVVASSGSSYFSESARRASLSRLTLRESAQLPRPPGPAC